MIDPITLMILGTGMLVALSGALVGSFLVLRGQSMAGDAISHAIVLGIVLAWMLTGAQSGPVSVIGAALAGVGAVLGAQALMRSRLLAQDAATGLVFPAMFAAGVLLINLNARNLHLDVDTVLLGEIGFVWLDTVQVFGLEVPQAAVTLAVVTLIDAIFIAAFWKELRLMAFDPGLAAALGFRPGLLGLALLVLTAVTAVAAFEAVGVVLFLAFLIVPAVTGRLVSGGVGAMIGVAVVSGLVAVGIGHWAALTWDVSIGGSMALATGLGLVVALAASPRSGLVAARIRRRSVRLEARVAVLLAHLHAHESTEAEPEECTPAALIEHLGWSMARAEAVLIAAQERGVVRREGNLLHLTEAGRALAVAEARRTERAGIR
ncbi:MAG: metal ABC transporter permease [Pararhodobacter sp.]